MDDIDPQDSTIQLSVIIPDLSIIPTKMVRLQYQ